MKLKIGIDKINPGWKIILSQQGYFWHKIDLDQQIQISEFACLIISEKISALNRKNLLQYVENGGVVITQTSAFQSLFSVKTKKKKIRWLQAAENSVFKSLGIIDFYSDFSFISDKNLDWLDRKLMIQTKNTGKGMIINLPFDIDDLYQNYNARRKKFWLNRKELPSEIVAEVSKGKIRKLLHKIIYRAYEKRNLPLVRISEFPAKIENFFLFRVDTDFCNAEQAAALHELCKKYNIRGAWFVDTKDPSTLKNVYAEMQDQEIGLHCRRHLVFADYAANKKNIKNGLNDLKKAGISVSSFAAPFGDWNENLAQVLEDMNFSYSSEFVQNYDDLPYYPIVKGKSTSVLQLPIHPVSSGRLRRSHFTLDEMWNYFKNYIDECLENKQPIIIYHHPSHGHLQLFEKIFNYINQLRIPNFTFREFVDFWKVRDHIKVEIKFESEKLFITSKNKDINLNIEYKNKLAVASVKSEIKLEDLAWKERKNSILPKNLKRIRQWHWRDVLYDHESKKGKKIHENLSG